MQHQSGEMCIKVSIYSCGEMPYGTPLLEYPPSTIHDVRHVAAQLI